MKSLHRFAPTRAQLFTATLIASAMGISVAAVTLPHSFSAGTSASASQVNANFAALKAAVDTLQADAAAAASANSALQARVAAAESKLAPVGSNQPLASKRSLMGYAWADNPTSASYTPNALYSFNSSGGAITAARQGAGLYLVTFAGLGANGAAASGNVQVSGYNSDALCNVVAWVPGSSANDLVIQIQCRVGGTPTDSRFSLLFVS